MAQVIRAILTLPHRLTEGPAAWLQALRDRLTDPYRPELHYMRGPGPKWREKHGQNPMAGSPAVGASGVCQAGA